MPVLADRAKLSVVGRLGFANVPLRKHLTEIFSRPYGESGAFLADPTFEAVFGWKKGEFKMSELAGNLLTPALVNAMDAPPAELRKDYRFAKDQHPYDHQIKSWKILAEPDPKSLVVASGTGSGKTECFMIPILDSLAREREQLQSKLIGVRALFLYPLNALINSQRDRFRAWTSAFGEDIRFCLYNGNTPERPEPARIQKQYPSEVLDRISLRSMPPPLLVTNATMLEYMLVRTADAPILAKSQGKLRWVVLDEAHTYVGSQAAEAALLIRRVLLGFGVKPNQVRFVATSATIGDPEGEAGQKLRRFLADVAGVDLENVFLVAGQREIPKLIQTIDAEDTIADPSEISSENLFATLAKNPIARRIRHLFIGDPSKPSVARLSEVSKVIHANQEFTCEQIDKTLKWLDLLTSARDETGEANGGGEWFLPLRAHLFHQTLTGVWACADYGCSFKTGTLLDDPAWSFGKVYLEPRKHCDCGSPVYETVKCDGCGTVHLRAGVDQIGRVTQLQPQNAQDEFELDVEAEEAAESQIEDDEQNPRGRQHQILIVNQNNTRLDWLKIEKNTRQIVESGENLISVRAFEDGGDGLICPVCEQREKSGTPLFQASRIGAPFLIGGILPTLLEFAPDGEHPAEHSYRGRRLLSFNDSRQGTARMAAKLQQEAERNRIRGLIYHLTLAEGIGNKSIEINELLTKINQIETALEMPLPADAKSLLENSLEETHEKINSLSKPSVISFDDLARKLTQQGRDFLRMLQQYRQYSPGTFSEASGDVELARIFLVREFGRRPKRLNNLETMGMVKVYYPALESITQLPSAVAQVTDFELSEWRDFLKMCLDFFVRGGGSLEISQSWRNWLGMKYPQKPLVSRDEDYAPRRQRRWLRAERGGRMSPIVRLLTFILKADLSTPDGVDRVDLVLDAAWRDLISAGLLRQTADGRMLPLGQLAFASMDSAWVCPVTRRFLDTTVRGITPYLPEKSSDETAYCKPVRIPLYDEPFSGVTDDLERIKIGREWLNSRADVVELRNRGLWSAPNDRVIELSPYFTTGEHSAQQDSATLQRYEKDFKEGALNLLSCSTTMEMGIDIGGISVVAMNNVPPHPANYLQRAGRAGRRRESRSLAVTLCKSNPHDQEVFSQTRWAFDSVLPAPSVSLDSQIIVQRHINSYLLANFLRAGLTASSVESTKLTCGIFFIGEESLAAGFSAWCRGFDSTTILPEIREGLEHLSRHSVLESQNFSQKLECAAASLEEIAVKWRQEWQLLDDEEQEFLKSNGEKNKALIAVKIHKERLVNEYLLRELATRGFLPAYGFPTNIASFDNLTIGQYKKDRQTREDNRFRRRELASRDLITALREYAPGSEVVIDGLVYVSAGVTLNWHIPADQQEVKEIQDIRWAWRCTQCGASGSTHSLSLAQHCQHCSSAITANNIAEFLEPSGFAVDFYREPGNDVSTQHFVPVEAPWIDAEGEWHSLINPILGRFRVSARGHVFNQSRGINGAGYALCLECGRAEPMSADKSLPGIFENPHRKLRRAKDEGAFCSGSFDNWKIKRNISLGHRGWTDIFELQIKSTAGVTINDKTAALTLAVALRDALAELLGVQASELGCDVKPARTENGGVCQSILIFDRFAAGYASSANRFLAELFDRAAQRLMCPINCDSACPHCVLDYDQRFAADSLDRHQALGILTQDWLKSFRLPENLAFFGVSSQLETKSFAESLWQAAANRHFSKVRLYTYGQTNDWDVAPSPLRELAYKLAGKNIEVEIVVAANSLQSLDDNDCYVLASLADHPKIKLLEISSEPRVGSGWLLAEAFTNTIVGWAVAKSNSLLFDSDWGTNAEFLIKSENCMPFSDDGRAVSAQTIRPNLKEFGDKELEIQNQLDGNIQGFGQRFWEYLKSNHPATKALLENPNEKISSVSYTDRYFASPVNLKVLYQIVSGLRKSLDNDRAPAFDFSLITASADNNQYQQYKIWSNWVNFDDRNEVAKLVFNEQAANFSLSVKNKHEISHGRTLKIEFASGKTLLVRFDQGVDYWRRSGWAANSETIRFNFNAGLEQQRNRILNLDNEVVGGTLPTQIFLKIET
ncbi:MAG: DEAD/DEAH box helicase [Pyrinomonadaceae bacterium]